MKEGTRVRKGRRGGKRGECEGRTVERRKEEGEGRKGEKEEGEGEEEGTGGGGRERRGGREEEEKEERAGTAENATCSSAKWLQIRVFGSIWIFVT